MATPESSSASKALPMAMNEELSDDDFSTILERMWNAKNKWYFIGVRFNIPVSELDTIETNNPKVENQFIGMIKKWLEMGQNCTWKAIHDALKHHTVDCGSIAKEFEQWILTRLVKGKKRKRTACAEVAQKKIRLDKSKIFVRKGTECPSMVSSGVAASCNGCAYFPSGYEIHEFEVASKNWTQHFDCPYESFGLVAKENELIVIGGVDKSYTPTNKMLSFSLERKEWEEKYPPMSIARVNPQVIVADKYLIVLGGRASIIEDQVQMFSVEVFDFETKCWFSNEGLNLPEGKVPDMKWMSACICGNDVYVAARHCDPEHKSMTLMFEEDEENDDTEDSKDDEDSSGSENSSGIYPHDPYPCYSLFRCPIKTVNTIQEGKKVAVWHKVEYPHPSVYKKHDSHVTSDVDDNENVLQTEYYCYSVCRFAISCINDRLIAVGCNHIKSMSHEDLRRTLYDACSSYRQAAICSDLLAFQIDIKTEDPEDTICTECCIYEYCSDNDSWRLIKSTPDNGSSDEPPSVASVDGSLVIMRNSKTVHVIDFP